MSGHDQHKPPKLIPIFIDGEKHEVADQDLTAADLLALVGKTSSEWYIVYRHGREQKEYHNGDILHPAPGGKYLTVSTGPTPVS
jgi:hypothetical protein